jgi:hypothetical protein
MKEKEDYSLLNDGDLVKAIQQGFASPLVLYTRYLPMIYKYGFKAKYNFDTTRDNDFVEDYKQEAYFWLLDAIAYTKADKITGPNWKFEYVFYYFLKNLSNKFKRVRYAMIKNNWIHQDPNEQVLDLIICQSSCFHDEVLDASLMENFYSHLTPRQTKILKLRQDGHTMTVIADIIGMSYALVNLEIQRSKKIAEEVFCVCLS